MSPLERCCRLLMLAYPASYRRDRGEEVLGTLLEATPGSRKRPLPRDACALLLGGLRARIARHRRHTTAANLRLAVLPRGSRRGRPGGGSRADIRACHLSDDDRDGRRSPDPGRSVPSGRRRGSVQGPAPASAHRDRRVHARAGDSLSGVSEPMTRDEFVEFVRSARLGVVATTSAHGDPEAALVDLAVTSDGEVVFDTKAAARKVANIEANPHVALVVGWEDRVSVQVEGDAEVLSGDDREKYGSVYLEQYPGARAHLDEFALVRVVPRWLRIFDARPGSFRVVEGSLD